MLFDEYLCSKAFFMPYALMKSLIYRKTLLGMPWCKGEDMTGNKKLFGKAVP